MLNKEQSSGRSRVRKMVGGMVATLALLAAMSSSASAAFVASPNAWYTGTYPGTKLAGTEPATITNKGSFWFAINWYGTPVTIRGTGSECVGCVVENSGSSALVKGKLKFTGMSIEGLPGCMISSSLETKPMVGTVGSSSDGLYLALQWAPAEKTIWGTFEMTGCSFSGLYKLNGSAIGRLEDARGVFTKTDGVSFSESITNAYGGALQVGVNPAILTAGQTIALSSGKEFSIKEK